MATITQRPNGVWEHRRRVPDRLRKVLNLKHDIRRSLHTKDKAEAQRRVLAVIAEVDRLFAAAGQVVTLDHRAIVALAAEWLASRVSASESSPPDADTIDVHLSALQDASEGRRVYPEGSPRAADESRRTMVAFMSSAVDSLLMSKGLPNVDQTSREELAVALFWNDLTYWQTMSKRRAGDYGLVPGLSDAPLWVPPVLLDAKGPSDDANAVTVSGLFRAWAAARKPAQKTIDTWGAAVGRFVAFIGHDDAKRVTGTDVVRWKNSLLESGKSGSTINNKEIAALRLALGHGVDELLLPVNVAKGLTATVARGSKARMRGYTDDEARTVLSAARQFTGWRRWLPFLSAYTGTRISEPADAAAADVKVSPEGIWYLDMDHRKLKNESSARAIPLHPALRAEGFLEYVQGLPVGGPLFPDLAPGKRYGKRGDTASKVVSRWVRKDLGITDERIQPNHAWRHRMATLHRAAKVPRDASRYLRGYRPEDDADNYGSHNLAPLAEYMARIPAMV